MDTTIAVTDKTRKRLVGLAKWGESLDTVINHVIDLAEARREKEV